MDLQEVLHAVYSVCSHLPQKMAPMCEITCNHDSGDCNHIFTAMRTSSNMAIYLHNYKFANSIKMNKLHKIIELQYFPYIALKFIPFLDLYINKNS